MGAITLGMDTTVIIKSFAVVLIGGAGNFVGAFLGAMVIGLMQSFGILFFPRMAIAFIFITLCTVLVIKPEGFLGKRM